jgi:hypothetical protein
MKLPTRKICSSCKSGDAETKTSMRKIGGGGKAEARSQSQFMQKKIQAIDALTVLVAPCATVTMTGCPRWCR